MGLDMYFYAKRWFSHDRDDKGNCIDKKEVAELRKIFPEMYKSGNLDSVEIKFEVGYWRKANQIHKWFVDNFQEAVDDCKSYEVSREQIKELLKLVNEVLKKCKLIKGDIKEKVIDKPEIACKILPTMEGFFFGNSNYDEWYYEKIKDTKVILEKCLKLSEDWYFEYHSSW